MRLILALALAGLAGCTQEEPRQSFSVTVVFAAHEVELHEKCGNDMIIEPLGCAKRTPSGCTIIAFKPKGFDDHRRLETLGHELLHCIAGPVHT